MHCTFWVCSFLGTRVWAAAGRTGQGLAAAADAADHSRKAPTSPRHDDARRGLAGYDHDTSGRRHAAAMSGCSAAVASAVASMASSVSLLAAMITEEAAAASLARRKRSHVPPRRGKERPLSVWPRRPRLHPNLPLLASSCRKATPSKVSCFVCQPLCPAPLHAYTTNAGAREGRQASAERVSGRGAHRHTPMTAAAEDWKRKVLSGWREHRPSYKVNRQDKTRQDVPLGEDLIDRDSPRTATACLFVRDGSCSTRCWASSRGYTGLLE